MQSTNIEDRNQKLKRKQELIAYAHGSLNEEEFNCFKNFMDFIYKTTYEQINSSSNDSIRAQKKYVDGMIDRFVEDEDGILTLLRNNFSESIKRLLTPQSSFFETLKNGWYNHSEKEVDYTSYFINLYAMLLSFQSQTSHIVCNSLSNYFIHTLGGNLGGIFDSPQEHCLNLPNVNVKKAIKALVSSKYFSTIPACQKKLLTVLENSYDNLNSIDFELIADIDEKLTKIKSDGKEIGASNQEIFYIMNEVISRLGETSFVYAPILTFGNRFSYINDMLSKRITNKSILEEIGKKISTLDIDSFRSDGDQSDFFIDCMNIVFDSDTYRELDNKINYLREVDSMNYCLKLVDKKTISHQEVLTKLQSDDLKEKRNGKVIAFPKGTIDLIEKPDDVFERMMHLYKEEFDEMDKNEISRIVYAIQYHHYYAPSIESFYEYLNGNLLQNVPKREVAEEVQSPVKKKGSLLSQFFFNKKEN